jgi:ribosomal protein L7/L12
MIEVLIAIIVILLVTLGLVVFRRRRPDSTDLLGAAFAARDAEHAREAHAVSDGPPATGADAVLQQIRLLLAQRKKIHAVKLWREVTGVPLAEAVRAVDLIAAGGTPALPPTVLPPAGRPAGQLLGPELMTNAQTLKLRGQPIEAIRLVRQHTGMSLREAKNVVDSL